MENEDDSDFLADDKFNACSKVDMEIVVVSVGFNFRISIYSPLHRPLILQPGATIGTFLD
jgi:hypothetical protein